LPFFRSFLSQPIQRLSLRAIKHSSDEYREVDAAFGPASPTVRRLNRADVVGEPAVLAVEDEPAPAPRPDSSSHLDEKPCSTVGRDRDVGGAADDRMAGLFHETQKIERLTANR